MLCFINNSIFQYLSRTDSKTAFKKDILLFILLIFDSLLSSDFSNLFLSILQTLHRKLFNFVFLISFTIFFFSDFLFSVTFLSRTVLSHPLLFPRDYLLQLLCFFFIRHCLSSGNHTSLSLQIYIPIHKPRNILYTHLLAVSFQLLYDYFYSENQSHFTVNISGINNIFALGGPHCS